MKSIAHIQSDRAARSRQSSPTEQRSLLLRAASKAEYSSRLLLTGCLALFVSAATIEAQTWGTVLDAEGPTGESVYQVTADSAGNLFAAGSVHDETDRYHAVIMKSSDAGVTWANVVDLPAESDLWA